MEKNLSFIAETFDGAFAAMHDFYLEDGKFDAESLKIMGDAFADLLSNYKKLEEHTVNQAKRIQDLTAEIKMLEAK